MEETTRPFQRQKWDLEVQGRVQNADIPYLAKHLTLLHRNHHLTTLLAQKAHSCVFYNRTKETLTELRSTKHGLMKIISQAKLTYYILLTALMEVMMVLNSQPLSVVSSDDLEELLIPFRSDV